MGACQSTFGASTSGQGLSASQLAACIRAAARAGSTLAFKGLEDVDYATPQTVEVEMADGPDKGTKLSVTSFAAHAFRCLRAKEGIHDDFFESEWVLPEEHIGLRETEGRSRAMFLVSNHRCLLCKTVSEGEVNTLLQMLPSLNRHLTQNPNSLLQRFVLALRITDVATGEVGWVCVFTDIFAKCPVLHEKWDLKGRQPKAAKYLFLPVAGPAETQALLQESAVLGISSSSATSGGDNRKSDESLTSATATSGPAPVGEESAMWTKQDTDAGVDVVDEDKDVPVTKVYRDGYDRVVARKDNALTRVFWLPGNPGSGGVDGSSISMRDLLYQAIVKDDDFLCANGVLDYSVLIGVTYVDPHSPFRAMRYNEHFAPVGAHAASPTSPLGAAKGHAPQQQRQLEDVPCESRDTCDGVRMAPASLFHRGVDSSGRLEVYHVGIIDMLTAYTVPKKSANFFKNFLWTDATLSTVPPQTYRDRAVEFFNHVVVPGPPAFSTTTSTATVAAAASA